MDLALNSDRSVFLNDRNDLATVDGLEQFEQEVQLTLTDFMFDSLSEYDHDSIIQRLRQQVTRVARTHDLIGSIDYTNISQKEDDPTTYIVEVTYRYAEGTFTAEVTA